MRDDQARGLRQLFARRTCHVAAVCGTEGAKVCIDISVAASAMGYGVCVLDRTVGDAARVIGRRARFDLAHVLDHDCTLEQALLVGHQRIAVLPAARGLERIGAESGDWQSTLQRALPALAAHFDLWLVNGLLPGHVPAAPMILAINPSAAAVTNAYGHIKALARAQGRRRFGMIVHGAASSAAARRVCDCVGDTARRFLGAELELYGWVPDAGTQNDIGSQQRRADAFTRIADKLMTELSTPLLRTGSC
ncbi:MAG TPA: hypothetical protein VFC24_11840 [Casimicrobiaceae bacterium]|nr:hypothetical protein [Casimicrobiaceae bacterium]